MGQVGLVLNSQFKEVINMYQSKSIGKTNAPLAQSKLGATSSNTLQLMHRLTPERKQEIDIMDVGQLNERLTKIKTDANYQEEIVYIELRLSIVIKVGSGGVEKKSLWKSLGHETTRSTTSESGKAFNSHKDIVSSTTDNGTKKYTTTNDKGDITDYTLKRGDKVSKLNTATVTGDNTTYKESQTRVRTDGNGKIIHSIDQTKTESKKTLRQVEEDRKQAQKDEGKKRGVDTNLTLYSKEKTVKAAYISEPGEKHAIAKSVNGQANYTVFEAEAKAGAKAVWDPSKGLDITGSAGAKVTLVGRGYKITAGPYPFSMLGESLRAEFTAGVSAEVAAEVNGTIAVKAYKGGKNVGIELNHDAKNSGYGAGAGVNAFAGAKAGVEVGAKVDWQKKKAYQILIESFLNNLLAEKLPKNAAGTTVRKLVDYIARQFDIANIAGAIMFGSPGWTNLLAVKGGVEGSAGIGGSAAFDLGLAGGRIKAAGTLKGTVGLGIGGKVNLDMAAVNGIRFLALMAWRGAHEVVELFGVGANYIAQFVTRTTRQVSRWLGKQIYSYGTGKVGYADYFIPDSTALNVASLLGYHP